MTSTNVVTIQMSDEKICTCPTDWCRQVRIIQHKRDKIFPEPFDPLFNECGFE